MLDRLVKREEGWFLVDAEEVCLGYLEDNDDGLIVLTFWGYSDNKADEVLKEHAMSLNALLNQYVHSTQKEGTEIEVQIDVMTTLH